MDRAGFVVLLCTALISSAYATSMNGFDLGNSEIAVEKIYRGGPDRDGIPSIDHPRFLSFAEVDGEIDADDPVLGVILNGVSRAYPVAILNWHEIVNDRIGNVSIAVTYCPLCGSGVVFQSENGMKQRSFGVSGLLYNSDMLLYDRETESLWSQLLGRAISGTQRGTVLQQIPVLHTDWRHWKALHPETMLLSRETGFSRDYDRDPYAGYTDQQGTYFPVEHLDRRYHPKERVLGVEIDGQFKGYPYSELSQGASSFPDKVGGKSIRIHYDSASGTAWATAMDGTPLSTISSFWFAWMAFHPQSATYRHTD